MIPSVIILSRANMEKLVKAGYYGAVIEDQGRPRKCGHLSGKNLNLSTSMLTDYPS